MKNIKITSEFLDNLEKKAKAATPGPWQNSFGKKQEENNKIKTAYKIGMGKKNAELLSHGSNIGIQKINKRICLTQLDQPQAIRNAEFIAAANPAAIMALTENLKSLILEIPSFYKKDSSFKKLKHETEDELEFLMALHKRARDASLSPWKIVKKYNNCTIFDKNGYPVALVYNLHKNICCDIKGYVSIAIMDNNPIEYKKNAAFITMANPEKVTELIENTRKYEIMKSKIFWKNNDEKHEWENRKDRNYYILDFALHKYGRYTAFLKDGTCFVLADLKQIHNFDADMSLGNKYIYRYPFDIEYEKVCQAMIRELIKAGAHTGEKAQEIYCDLLDGTGYIFGSSPDSAYDYIRAYSRKN